MLFQPQHSEKQPISASPRPCAGGYHQGNDSAPPNSAGATLFGGRVAQRFSFLRVDWETTRDRAFSSKVGKLRRAKPELTLFPHTQPDPGSQQWPLM